VSQRTVTVVGVIVALALAVTLLAVAATVKTRSVSPRLVPLTPAALAYQADAGHPHSTSQATQSGDVGTASAPAVLSSGMGHR
jgi:hypothetical protein